MGVSTHLDGPGFSRAEANVIGERLRDEGQHAANDAGDALGREVSQVTNNIRPRLNGLSA
jgi:hypothetical protein